MSTSKYWAVVPAAGVGKRMESAIPKQYLSLAGRPVIDHTLQRLLGHPSIEGVYVAVGKADDWWPDMLYARHSDVVRIDGGSERCYSVLNALKALSLQADANDWVLVHDAARPCLRAEDISRLIESAVQHQDGCLLGMPVRDTMKRSDADQLINETVDRDNLWHAFTPQMFRLGHLLEALQGAIDANYLVTDEASAIEWAGQKPMMVEGHADNIKITRPEDLALAEYYLSQQAL